VGSRKGSGSPLSSVVAASWARDLVASAGATAARTKPARPSVSPSTRRRWRTTPSPSASGIPWTRSGWPWIGCWGICGSGLMGVRRRPRRVYQRGVVYVGTQQPCGGSECGSSAVRCSRCADSRLHRGRGQPGLLGQAPFRLTGSWPVLPCPEQPATKVVNSMVTAARVF